MMWMLMRVTSTTVAFDAVQIILQAFHDGVEQAGFVTVSSKWDRLHRTKSWFFGVLMWPFDLTIPDACLTHACDEAGAHAGCDSADGEPEEGSARLMPLDAVATLSKLSTPCDPVHTGILEVLSDGAWVPVCAAAAGGPAAPAFVAAVACRNLGYPYSALVNPDAPPVRSPADPYSAYEPSAYEPVADGDGYSAAGAAKAAACSGTEPSLSECAVLDAVAGSDIDGAGGYEDHRSGYAEGPTAIAPGPMDSEGGCARGGGGMLAVACMMMPLEGTPFACLHHGRAATTAPNQRWP